MVYTINYKEILAFKKDDSNRSVKDYDATINKIFSQISNIKSNLKIDSLVVITFDETVKFVDPLFFILLFDVCCEYNTTLVIDIRYMDKNSQHYIYRLLTQYSDLEQFQTYTPHAKKDNQEIYITIDMIIKSDENERDKQFKRLLGNNSNSIHLFSREVHKKSLIKDTKYEYSMLPILKLRNFKLREIDNTVHEDTLDPYDKRIDFYNKLSLLQANIPNKIESYRTNLQNKIEELLLAVGLRNRGLSSSFRDIFFELIDNIRKHTPVQANAHISFRKDAASDLYELIISDNSCKGFLNTYRETLEKEQERLEESGVDKKLLKNYIDVVEDIDNKKYKKVLKGLFQIQKDKSDNPEDEMHIHQIPRIAMHFGLPLLVKLLEKLSKVSDIVKPKLKLYLHNDNQFFEIIYSFKNGKFQLDVNDKSLHRKEGSYIIITFPTDVSLSNTENTNSLVSINLQNNDYKLFIDKKEDIEKQINKFTFYLDKQIADDLDSDLNKSYGCEYRCTFIKYTGHNTFSEFLRNIYLYAYKHDIEDMVIVNVPLYEYTNNESKRNNENTEHIKLLETIMYGDEKVQYEKSLNILFYSDRYPEAILIGGKNKEEYCYFNKLLPSWGQSHDSNIRNSSKIKKPDQISSSELFVSFDKKDYIIPFELFEIYDENRRNRPDIDRVSILQDMLEKYLNEVAKRDNVHIDTGAGYHIDRFMEFKKVFEDSRWVRRLAFRLAMEFPKRQEDKRYYLYGTDKYTNMLISLCYTFLNLETFDRFRYKLFNIYDDYDYKVLREKIQTLKEKDTHEIYLISSVVVGAKRDKELIEDYDIKAIPAIQLNIEDTDMKRDNHISPLITITLKKEYTKEITADKYCEACEGQRNIPLLEFTKNDPFFIKDTFFDSLPSKKIKSYSSKNDIAVRWFDSLNFGHVERGNNHFLYYINTIKFFNQNRKEIKNFLSNNVAGKVHYDKDKREKIILLTSSHDTNNNFVALVNQEVFDNEAIVLNFNKSRGEANFHDLKSYEYFDWENTRVFFVDDSIASSHTLKYFYQLLRSVPGIMNTSNVGLNGVIVMIDRISSYDETILCSYLRDTEPIDKPNKEVLKLKLQYIHAFTTFDVKPIKAEVEECFLCKRRDRYSELSKKSALDLTTFQMARRAYKLKKIAYREVTPAKEKPLVERFKIYLKAMATSYIYQNYVHREDFGEFDTLLEEFSNRMYENIVIDKEERFKKYEEKFFRKIIKFQSEIALLKALSSPKLSYYYSIRKWSVSTILAKLKNEVDKIESKDFILTYYFKDDIMKSSIKESDEKDIDFFQFYKNMTNLHLINIYFTTLGYFEDSKILDTDYIRLYYKITQNKDIRNIKNNSLLHTYPFAVKFTISDNLEKANYFEKNLNKVFDGIHYKAHERKKKYAHINALKIENTLYWKDFIKSKTGINIKAEIKKLQQEENIEEKIEIIKKLFKSIFGNLKVHLFVSPYATITPKSYQVYLDDSEKELINILDSFNGIGNYTESMVKSVQKVFYGAIDKTKDNEEDVILEKVSVENVVQTIDNTWANEYTDDYIVIRLTSINTKLLFAENESIKNNDPVWFRPVGCIVIEKKNTDYNLHMEATRTILSLKEHIVGYLEKEFNYGIIQEAIIKKNIRRSYMTILSQIHHSVKDYIGLDGKINDFLKVEHSEKEYRDYLEQLSEYSWGLMLLTSLSKLKYDEREGSTNIAGVLSNTDNQDTDFVESLRHFLLVTKHFTAKLRKDVELDIRIHSEKHWVDLSREFMQIIIFEMIFNALKRMTEDDKALIVIEVHEESIEFKNTCNDDIEKHIDKINNTSSKETTKRMGISTIKELLSKVNYTLLAKKEENIIHIVIERKKKI